ncbi:hypothetical protein RJ640_002185 [Escallonia rubra]|uniref:Protein kinase domain-containing protein n=1 Tax=Escallonia rubra TaxID=112253 RepID=A0AA88QZB9_9ASTE|nr:hypothetical protein RJ640_002185 [Escallonia rubra]
MWRSVKIIGQGGFGVVKMATVDQEDEDCHLPPVIAVKSAPLVHSESLQKEREAFSDLEGSPYLVHCYKADASEEDGVLYYNLLLEYANGGSLADRVKHGGRLCEEEARKHTKSMLNGLHHIHEGGYVHCDIKPGNVLLVDGAAKIADLGLAKKIGERNQKRSGLRGTTMYMAPGAVAEGDYGAKGDIWALGCTVLQLLTGKPPWDFKEKADDWNVLYRIGFSDKLPEITRSGMSEEAIDFLRKCLVRDPRLRWSSDMLMKHAFVTSSGKASAKKIARKAPEKSSSAAAVKEAASREDSLLFKPNQLLMMMKRRAQELDTCRAHKKKKGMGLGGPGPICA